MTEQEIPKFLPKQKTKPILKHIGLAVELDLYEEIKRGAASHSLSIDQFSIQAIKFALLHLSDPENKEEK